jgi:hypothetical protein
MEDLAYRDHAGGVLRFLGHFLGIVVAMGIGMWLLDPLWLAVLPGVGGRVDLYTVVMVTNMAITMVLWMRLRRNGWAAVGEATAAVYLSFLVVLVPFWAGSISASAMLLAGHGLMLVAVLAAMLRRRTEYTHRHNHSAARRVAGFMRRRST